MNRYPGSLWTGILFLSTMRIEEEIKQNRFQGPKQKAIINLIFTTNWLLNQQQDFFKPFGITAQQFNILRILKGQHPNAISAREIRSRMLDKNSDVSRLLDRLIRKALVEKKICPSDKRASDVFITTGGLDLLKQLDERQREMDNFIQLSDEEATQLSDLLDKTRG